MTKLSPRLEAVAALVPRGAKVADVGTDHGYLAICLLERGIAANVVATDIRPGPLAGAKQNIAQAGLSDRISLKLCDGLDAVEPEQADVIVIAGRRSRGIGRIGLRLLCKAARERGVRVLYDNIALGNPAIALFLSEGFFEEYRTDDCIYLRKDL